MRACWAVRARCRAASSQAIPAGGQQIERAQQAPVQVAGLPLSRRPEGIRRAGQVGGDPVQVAPGPRGIRGAHPLAVFVPRQPALREPWFEHSDSSVTFTVGSQYRRVPGLRPDQVRTVILPH